MPNTVRKHSEYKGAAQDVRAKDLITDSQGPAAESSEPEFAIRRTFAAPSERMFKAWTDPKLLALWWGPRGIVNDVAALDARSGGTYRIVMRGPDGIDYPIKGVFHEVTAPSRLVLTMDCSEHPAAWQDRVKPGRAEADTNPAGEALMTVSFEPTLLESRLTIRIRFESAAIRDAMLKMGLADGWSQSLERLAVVLADTSGRELVTSRVLDAPRDLVFEAFIQPEHLAQWWGPKGFTNTFHEFDPRPGGIWRFSMHSPSGAVYENMHVFLALMRPGTLVLQHISAPRFQLTVTLIDEASKTQLTWDMLFETEEECARVKPYAVEANEQNLDRLEAELAKMGAVERREAA
jgi:uncharacterized protein YndB with AHSA1/START domain